MKSKTLIEKHLRKKTNPVLVETIIAAKKAKQWNKVAELISSSRKQHIHMNLNEIDSKSESGETIVLSGKVLSQGDLNKKIKMVALGISDKAEEKLKKSGSEFKTILEEIKSNPDAKGIKIIKK